VGAYGTIWPVVHQLFGVRPDLGRSALEIVPQVPLDSPKTSGENIRLGNGSAAVSADAAGDTYTTTVTVEPDVALREPLVGHAVPADKETGFRYPRARAIEDYRVRKTDRGNEVLLQAAPDGGHTLVVDARWKKRASGVVKNKAPIVRCPKGVSPISPAHERDSALTKSLRP
jgi:hypothetical protein